MITPTGAQRAAALATLGLSADARPEEITAAYRRLVRALHPDATGRVDAAAAADFVAVCNAYHLLVGSRAGQSQPAEPAVTGTRRRVHLGSLAQEPPIAAGPVVVIPLSGSSRRMWRQR